VPSFLGISLLYNSAPRETRPLPTRSLTFFSIELFTYAVFCIPSPSLSFGFFTSPPFLLMIRTLLPVAPSRRRSCQPPLFAVPQPSFFSFLPVLFFFFFIVRCAGPFFLLPKVSLDLSYEDPLSRLRCAGRFHFPKSPSLLFHAVCRFLPLPSAVSVGIASIVCCGSMFFFFFMIACGNVRRVTSRLSFITTFLPFLTRPITPLVSRTSLHTPNDPNRMIVFRLRFLSFVDDFLPTGFVPAFPGFHWLPLSSSTGVFFPFPFNLLFSVTIARPSLLCAAAPACHVLFFNDYPLLFDPSSNLPPLTFTLARLLPL